MDDVTKLVNASIVNAAVACANTRVAGMVAENKAREIAGQSLAYTENDFNDVILKEGIHWNAVCQTLRGY